jgi:hypothetical protein
VILKPHAHILLNHTSETEDAIKLFARRDDVDRINNENIHRLPSAAIVYKCVDHFDFKEHHKSDSSLEKNTRQGDNDTLVALVGKASHQCKTVLTLLCRKTTGMRYSCN